LETKYQKIKNLGNPLIIKTTVQTIGAPQNKKSRFGRKNKKSNGGDSKQQPSSDFDFNKGERVELRRVGIGGMPYLLGVNPFNRHIIAYELWKGKGFGPPPKIRNYLQRLLPRSRAENQNFGSFSPHFLHES